MYKILILLFMLTFILYADYKIIITTSFNDDIIKTELQNRLTNFVNENGRVPNNFFIGNVEYTLCPNSDENAPTYIMVNRTKSSNSTSIRNINKEIMDLTRLLLIVVLCVASVSLIMYGIFKAIEYHTMDLCKKTTEQQQRLEQQEKDNKEYMEKKQKQKEELNKMFTEVFSNKKIKLKYD